MSDMPDRPLERQPAAALIAALRIKAKQPGPLPEYIPEQLRGWMLRQKTRHSFHPTKEH
jgi:hypothetical protein